MVKINGNIPKIIKINGKVPDIVNINGSKVWQNEFTIDCIVKVSIEEETGSSGCSEWSQDHLYITGYTITANHFFPKLYLLKAVITNPYENYVSSYKPSSPILIESGKTYNLQFDLQQGYGYWCGEVYNINHKTFPVTLYFSAYSSRTSPFFDPPVTIPAGDYDSVTGTGPKVLYTGKISDIVEKENEIVEAK